MNINNLAKFAAETAQKRGQINDFSTPTEMLEGLQLEDKELADAVKIGAKPCEYLEGVSTIEEELADRIISGLSMLYKISDNPESVILRKMAFNAVR